MGHLRRNCPKLASGSAVGKWHPFEQGSEACVEGGWSVEKEKMGVEGECCEKECWWAVRRVIEVRGVGIGIWFRSSFWVALMLGPPVCWVSPGEVFLVSRFH